MDGRTIVRLLADDRRRRVLAAVVLGAATVDEVRDATGLEVRDVMVALERLASGELVEADEDGTWSLLADTFRHAAVATADADEPDDHGDASPDEARVLRAFVRAGRLLSIPAQRAKRLVVLDRIVQDFEPGPRYPERVVNERLARWHPDTATLRRFLVDEGFMEREAGEYWRTGGTVET